MPETPWTICRGCLAPVEVIITEPDVDDETGQVYAGAGWRYECPACGWEGSAPEEATSADIPSPTPADVVALLRPVLLRLGRDVVMAACGWGP